MTKEDQFEMLSFFVDHVEVGVFAIDRQFRITLWNGFMAMHSGLSAQEVMGRNLFDCFPELPLKWLEKKFKMFSC